jgi:hypothetical protein
MEWHCQPPSFLNIRDTGDRESSVRRSKRIGRRSKSDGMREHIGCDGGSDPLDEKTISGGMSDQIGRIRTHIGWIWNQIRLGGGDRL